MKRSTHTVIRNFHDLAKHYSTNHDAFMFIQIGANDGRIGDPLFSLVTEFGWRGVLIEPQKSVYEGSLIPNYADYDNLCFENTAIDEVGGRFTPIKRWPISKEA